MPAETHTQRTPIDRPTVTALVLEQVAELAGVPVEAIDPSSRLADLGLDALELIELAEALEEELGERTLGVFADDDLVELDTVNDAIDHVLARRG